MIMKNLQDYINYECVNEETLLDIEQVISSSDEKLLKTKEDELFNKYPLEGMPGHDAYGRKLSPGDWVVCVPPGSASEKRMQFGIVTKCSAKRTTISIPGKYGTYQYHVNHMMSNTPKPQYRGISVSSEYIFKIMDKNEFIHTL